MECINIIPFIDLFEGGVKVVIYGDGVEIAIKLAMIK